MMSLKRAGRPIPWDATGYARFGLGFYPVHLFSGPQPEAWPHDVAVAVAGAAFLAGAASLPWRRRALPLGAVLLVFAGLAAYYGLVARDPWSGEVGHTFNLFKICQWSFPVVSAAQVAGLALLLRSGAAGRVALGVACAAVAALSLPHHISEGRLIVAGVRLLAGPHCTLPELRRLRACVEKRDPPALYLVGAPDGPWPRCLPGYFFYPRPFANGWAGSGFFDLPHLRNERPAGAGTLYFQVGEPPFGDPKERLPGGFTAVDLTRPTIVRLDRPNGVEHWMPGGVAWLGETPAVVWVFAPRAGDVVLSFETLPGPSLPDTPRRRLRVTEGAGSSREHTIETGAGTTVRLPLRLPAGVSRLTLHCTDRASAALPHDPRVLLLGVIAARVEYAGSPNTSAVTDD